MARLLLVLAALLALAQPAAAQSFNAQEQAEIRAVVRDYLVSHPDVLDEALRALEARKSAQRVHRIESDPRDFSIGPANAPIVMVEFFDYRCPFCMAALPWVMDTLRTRRDIRFVFKELPLPNHGEEALEASRASLAAMPQGRYVQFHTALMNFRGTLDTAHINALARQSGVDVARMRRNMANPNITALLEENRGLAIDVSGPEGIGTPAFLINGRLITGFRDSTVLEAALRDAALEPRGSAPRASR